MEDKERSLESEDKFVRRGRRKRNWNEGILQIQEGRVERGRIEDKEGNQENGEKLMRRERKWRKRNWREEDL